MNRLKDIPLLSQPGERWSYSYTVDVQAAALEKMTGMTFGEYLDKNIFTPLGMNDTAFFLSEDDYKTRMATVYTAQRDQRVSGKSSRTATASPSATTTKSGGGGLTSTTHDYARFVQMLLNEGSLDGKQILKPETVKLMMSNHIGDKRSMGGGGFGWGGAVKTTAPSERSPAPIGTFDWFGIDGTWFWADPVNDIGFVGMIQRRGNAGPGAINLRGESPSSSTRRWRRNSPAPRPDCKARGSLRGLCVFNQLRCFATIAGQAPDDPGSRVLREISLGRRIERWPADALDLPAQLDAGLCLHRRPHILAEPFDVGCCRISGVDQEVAVHFAHLRSSPPCAAHPRFVDQLPGAPLVGRARRIGIGECRAAGLLPDRLRRLPPRLQRLDALENCSRARPSFPRTPPR